MKKGQFILRKSEIMILFNSLVDLGYDRNIQISIPLLNNLMLCTLQIKSSGAHISDFISFQDYKKTYIPLTKKMKSNAKKEVPEYIDIHNALHQSGILKLSGGKKLEDLISMLKKQDVLRGGDVYYIALDTNMLRDRFFNNYLSNIPPHPNLDYILCETVRDELKNRNEKYKRHTLRGMNPLPYGILETCFLNQNCLDDRMRYIGFLEYNLMRGATSCEEIETISKKSSAYNDRVILDAYSDFVDVGRKVIFISRDNEAIRMMTGEENVIPILFEYQPFSDEDFQAPWDRFFTFLYILGILFGKLNIIVGGIEICSIYGVWRGKDVTEWEEEMSFLDVFKPSNNDKEEIKDYQFIMSKLTSNISLLRKLQDLDL